MLGIIIATTLARAQYDYIRPVTDEIPGGYNFWVYTPTDYYYTYNYTLYLPSGTFPMSGDGFKIPNQWIVDGVNCSVESDRKWNVLPAAIDAGWTWCGRMSSDSDRFFKSVRRKMLYLTADGRRVLKDSNNSSLDFNPACTPSIIEVQQSAVNANGEKASTITYDGVQIIK